MDKFWIILGHTYTTRLKSKPFIITTILLIVLMIGVANLEPIIKFFKKDQIEEVLILDETNDVSHYLEGKLTENKERTALKLVPHQGSIEAGKELIEDDEYAGLLLVEEREGLAQFTYFSNHASIKPEESELRTYLQTYKEFVLMEKSGIDEALLSEINSPVEVNKEALDTKSKTDEELAQARGIVYIMIFVLHMAVLVYGQMIATDVATEKSSRVMEILISSAPPVTHMFAKIIGIALLGMTQAFILFITGMNLLNLKNTGLTGEVIEAFGLNEFNGSLSLYALIFFLLGYFLYATIAAMFGSIVSRVEDLQQLLIPMVSLLMIAFFIAMFGLTSPDSSFITAMSYVPFFSPMIMFLRVGMLDVAFWEVGLSISILIATIIIFAIIGAKIYRGGVLMYGPSRSLKDIKQAFKLTKK